MASVDNDRCPEGEAMSEQFYVIGDEVPCPVCGMPASVAMTDGPDWSVLICESCGEETYREDEDDPDA